MSFQLFSNPEVLLAYVAFVIALAAIGVVLVGLVAGSSLVGHHHERVARHESIPVYYRQLAFNH